MRPDEMIQLLPATAAQMDADEFDLQGVIAGLPEHYFQTGVEQGWASVTNILVAGKVCYRVYWQLRGLGTCCHFMASLFVGDGVNDTEVWSEGCQQIARKTGAKKLTFETARLGHVRQAMARGAVVTGVTMEKVL